MFVIEDANFLISVLKTSDKFHTDAIETLNILNNYSIEYVYPQVVINETIFVLLRSEYSSDVIRERINNLSMIPRVILQDTGILTVLRYASRYYKSITISGDISSKCINSTSDFIIACTAIDYNAVVISNDQRLLNSTSSAGIAFCCDFTVEEERKKLNTYMEVNSVSTK